MQKKDSRMVHDDIREEYLQSFREFAFPLNEKCEFWGSLMKSCYQGHLMSQNDSICYGHEVLAIAIIWPTINNHLSSAHSSLCWSVQPIECHLIFSWQSGVVDSNIYSHCISGLRFVKRKSYISTKACPAVKQGCLQGFCVGSVQLAYDQTPWWTAQFIQRITFLCYSWNFKIYFNNIV